MAALTTFFVGKQVLISQCHLNGGTHRIFLFYGPTDQQTNRHTTPLTDIYKNYRLLSSTFSPIRRLHVAVSSFDLPPIRRLPHPRHDFLLAIRHFFLSPALRDVRRHLAEESGKTAAREERKGKNGNKSTSPEEKGRSGRRGKSGRRKTIVRGERGSVLEGSADERRTDGRTADERRTDDDLR